MWRRLPDLWKDQYIIQIPTPITVSDTMITNVSIDGHECFASLSMASPSGEELCNDGTEPGVNHFTKLILNDGRHSGRIAYEIDRALDRHEVDNGAVLRRERFNVSSAVPVRFSERVLRALGREQMRASSNVIPPRPVAMPIRSGQAWPQLFRRVSWHPAERQRLPR